MSRLVEIPLTFEADYKYRNLHRGLKWALED